MFSRSAAPLMRPRILLWLLLTAASVHASAVDAPQTGENSSTPLKHLSLAQLGNIEVTTASKEPEERDGRSSGAWETYRSWSAIPV